MGSSRRWVLVAVVGIVLVYGAAVSGSDSIVAIGVGSVGPWDTVLEFANPSDQALTVQVSPYYAEFQVGCPNPCPWTQIVIPGNGTGSLHAADLSPVPMGLTLSEYICTDRSSVLPSTIARVVNTVMPEQGVELPLVRLSTLNDLNPFVLIFPSARRSLGVHTNLVIAPVLAAPTPPLPQDFAVRVEVFAETGQLVATGEFANGRPQGLVDNLMLVDVLGQLGIDDLSDGQIRVTLTRGSGSLWGETSAVDPAGLVSVAVGAVP
jgi:hypothetical protein